VSRLLPLALAACVALVGCGSAPPPKTPEPAPAQAPTFGTGPVLVVAPPDQAPSGTRPGAVPGPSTPNPYAGVSTRSTQDDLLLFVGAFVGVAGVTALMVGLGVAMTSIPAPK
jgi:hypothetical protein